MAKKTKKTKGNAKPSKNSWDNYEDEHRRAEQLGLNCRWLIGQLDAVFYEFCPPNEIGTWQQRAERAVERIKVVNANLNVPKSCDTCPLVVSCSVGTARHNGDDVCKNTWATLRKYVLENPKLETHLPTADDSHRGEG